MQYSKHYTIFKETSKLFLEYKEDLPPFNNLYTENEAGLHHTAHHEKFFPEIEKMFLEEYFNFVNEDYFLGCSFKVYQSNYVFRLCNFKDSYFDAAEIDFIKEELDTGIYKTKIDIFVTDKNVSKQIQFSLKRRFEYLQQRAKENGYHLIYNEKETYTIELTKQPLEPKQDEPLIDYSDSKLTEKIIALNELGVLDFLREKEPFNMTTFKLAEYLSLCLGEKATSIYPCINPIFNKTVKQKNNPYETFDTVKKTKKNLIQIGVKIE